MLLAGPVLLARHRAKGFLFFFDSYNVLGSGTLTVLLVIEEESPCAEVRLLAQIPGLEGSRCGLEPGFPI